MMRKTAAVFFLALALGITGCTFQPSSPEENTAAYVTAHTRVADVVSDPDFEGFGQFLFPLNGREPDQNMTLESIDSMLPYHNYINTDTTLDILNSMKDMVLRAKPFFTTFTPTRKRRRTRIRKIRDSFSSGEIRTRPLRS